MGNTTTTEGTLRLGAYLTFPPVNLLEGKQKTPQKKRGGEEKEKSKRERLLK